MNDIMEPASGRKSQFHEGELFSDFRVRQGTICRKFSTFGQ